MAEQVDLDKLEALEKAATPGPWDSHNIRRYFLFVGPNQDFTLALRNAAPALLAEVRELRENNQRLKDELALEVKDA